MIMPWGKHAGRELKEIPSSYLAWHSTKPIHSRPFSAGIF